MAYRLVMDKALAIKNLRANGMSERAIARTLSVSRNAVRRHLNEVSSNDTTAPTGSDVVAKKPVLPVSASLCEPFRDVILSKLEQGLDNQRIFQDLVLEYGFSHKYWSVSDSLFMKK